MSKHIHFTKMHGAGNDYIYVYTPQNSIPDPAEASIEWSRQHFGIGSDGLILIGDSPVPEADFSMRIFNNDGSEALMCGNGVRCVAKFVYDHKLTSKTDIAIDTLSGIKLITLHPNANGEVESATVDMGTPILSSKHLLATADGSMTDGLVSGRCGTFVSMGNPHFVCFVPDATSIDVATEGRRLEHDAIFPERCNIEFVSVKDAAYESMGARERHHIGLRNRRLRHSRGSLPDRTKRTQEPRGDGWRHAGDRVERAERTHHDDRSGGHRL